MAKEIASKKGIDEKDVGEKFIDVINEWVGKTEKKGRIIGKKYGESDDWILVTDTLDKVFISISEILDHNTGFEGYRKIPLEIAIGTGEYDKWARFDGKNLIIEKDTKKFLKTKIIGHYHKKYPSPKSTFIVLTESAYNKSIA